MVCSSDQLLAVDLVDERENHQMWSIVVHLLLALAVPAIYAMTLLLSALMEAQPPLRDGLTPDEREDAWTLGFGGKPWEWM